MCTAFPYGRSRGRRLQAEGIYAPSEFGSFTGGPWALRPKRLQWLMRFDFSKKIQNRTNISSEFKIAAFLASALSHQAFLTPNLSICGLEAVAGTFPSLLASPCESDMRMR